MQNAQTAQERRPAASKLLARWFIPLIFLAGFLFRLTIFQQPHVEGDELIYQSLVEQLEQGHGYTLQGSPILKNGTIDRMEYDHPLFFHPPGGIALFWFSHILFGSAGFAMVQLLSYAVFFASMMWLAHWVVRPDSSLALGAAAVLTAFTPIAAHVMSHYWLDGPLLAFTTLAAALFVFGMTNGQSRWALAGGAVLGFSSLIKETAVLAAPGFLLLAWALNAGAAVNRRTLDAARRPLGNICATMGTSPHQRLTLCLLVPVVLLHLPWKIWQLRKLGTIFPPNPLGKPSATLLASNLYVHYVTAVRSPLVYLTVLPRVLWTLTVSVAAWAAHWKNAGLRRNGTALLGWILIILVMQIGLGFFGYSKLMRYVVLVTPASVLLFSMAVEKCRRAWLWALAAGLALEVAQGIQTSLAKADLIIPLWGGM